MKKLQRPDVQKQMIRQLCDLIRRCSMKTQFYKQVRPGKFGSKSKFQSGKRSKLDENSGKDLWKRILNREYILHRKYRCSVEEFTIWIYGNCL